MRCGSENERNLHAIHIFRNLHDQNSYSIHILFIFITVSRIDPLQSTSIYLIACCLQVCDDCSGSDDESVQIFKEYALGQLQIWIKTTVERSRAALAFSQAEA